MFHLLLCVTENIKQSHAVRGGRFWIEFQPGQGNLTHTHEDRLRFRPRYFSLSFQSVDLGHPPRLQSPTTLHLYVRTKIKPTSTKRVNGRSTRRSNQILKLTNYHISRHVASTFKHLTKWATHRDLSHFDYTSGVSQLHNSARCPYILAVIKVGQLIFSRERQETTQLLPFLFSGATSREKDPDIKHRYLGIMHIRLSINA